MPMTDLRTYPKAMKPAWTNDGLSQGMSSATFLTGKQWKDWDGRMLVSFMGIGIHGTPVGNRLDVLNIAADGLSVKKVTVALPMPAGRFRAAVQGPDGNLYVATDEGDIHRLTPKIGESIIDGNAVLFVGAGFSLGAVATNKKRLESPACSELLLGGRAEMLRRVVFLLSLVLGLFPVTSPLAAGAQSILLRADRVIE